MNTQSLVQGVDEMLQQVGQEEVTFQKGFLPSDFQHLLSATVNSSLQKRLISIKARIAKHMEGDLELLHMVSPCDSEGLQRY